MPRSKLLTINTTQVHYNSKKSGDFPERLATMHCRLKGVAYLSALHMAVSMEKVNDAITFERSRFRKIHDLVSIVLISLILRLYSKGQC